jgi:hypothetical protein
VAEQKKPVLTALTGLRAVAAIGVVVSHTRVPESTPEHLEKIAGWGHIGVPLFFMLSGVVLALQLPEPEGVGGAPHGPVLPVPDRPGDAAVLGGAPVLRLVPLDRRP